MVLEDMIKSEDYVNIKCLWYWNPAYNFFCGLRPLNNDQDVLHFSKDVVGYGVVNVYMEHSVGIPEIIDDSELDVEDDVQCIGFKSADVTEVVTTDPNVVAEEVTIDPNVVAKEVTIDLNGSVEKVTTDPNGVAKEVTIYPNVVAEKFTTNIDEDYVASKSSFEDNEFQFSKESEESEMDWTKVLPQETGTQPEVLCIYIRSGKGLVSAVQGIDVNVESRLCVKHLYGNWKKKHPRLELKEVLWAAWERTMMRMKTMKEDAWKDINDLNTMTPQLWPIDDLNTMTPPVMRRAIGRPKKQRNKMNDEPRNPHILLRRFSSVTCAKYGAMGHNKNIT
ncbi:hypothetical protein KIW84_020741 [Lathyrus oleraceus]|uniref:Uncharacterized protein n=1 Tax=Pisum sativum TaxID=3888 RepID=A0A9D4Y6A9_PEA|nr:hypothetical protein KIW84_020741 [Pisum sativum]